ncbi:hypothetical protein PV326_004203 [Microctonus aethiopoides]|nr:hypothetical protein PV326_004203 [Microctonus aethiopoides]
MPRRPKKSLDEIFELIKDLNFFDSEGHIVQLSDPIWNEAENICEKQLKQLLDQSDNFLDTSHESNRSNWSITSPSHLKPLRTIMHLDEYTWRRICMREIDKNYGKMNRNPGERFFKIHGKCTECGATFNAYSMSEPEADNFNIEISIYDTKEIEHQKKQQLRKLQRDSLVKELRAMSAYA